MKRIVAAAVIASLGWTGSALADGVALVIGNGDYANAPDAVTAVRDAEAVADGLRAAGWDVTIGTDLDRFAMRRVISRFAETVGAADSIVLFYSGHALRSDGVTYMAPTDAQGDTLTDVVFDGVPLDLTLRMAADKPGRAVLFIDGAQLRGFRPNDVVEPGLAAMEGPEGVLIVSAAEPGRAVRRSRFHNSRFAQEVIDRFLQPGAAAQTVATESDPPIYVTGSVDADFVLAGTSDVVTADNVSAELELAFWRAAERSGAAADYAAYLRRFPEGLFASFARARLGLDEEDTTVPDEPEVDPAIQADRDLNLSRIRKRQIQTWLLALGFDPRGIDGLFGRGSRAAIKRWQQKNGFTANSWLTAEQVERLTAQGKAAIAEQERIAAEKKAIRDAEDAAYWSATGAKETPTGYRAYLDKYPDGNKARIARAALAKLDEARADARARRESRIFERARKADTATGYRDYLAQYPKGTYRDQALARVEQIEGAERAAAELARLGQVENALGMTEGDKAFFERVLRETGFAAGEPDGILDERTRAALKGFQASRGLKPTGFFDRDSVVTLVLESGVGQGVFANEPVPEGVTLGGRKDLPPEAARLIQGVMEALKN